MPPTPVQIKELLLNAFDKDDNIVDMGSVTKAIKLLESIPITREALEETRLGRLVQNVRKKATNSNLKKRCTTLIRQWQSQFLPPNAVKTPKNDSSAPSQDDSNTQKGASTSDGQKSKPANQTLNTVPVDKSKSENLRRRKRETDCSPTLSPSSRAPPPKKLDSSVSPLIQDGNGQDDSTLNGVSAKGDGCHGSIAVRDFLKTASPKTNEESPKTKSSIGKNRGSLKKLKQEKSCSPKSKKKNVLLLTNCVSPLLTPSKSLQSHSCEGNSSPGNVSPGEKRPTFSPGSSNSPVDKRSKDSSNGKSPRSSNSISSSSSPAVGNSAATQGSCFATDWDFAGGEDSQTHFPLDEALTRSTASAKSQSIFDLDCSESVPPEASYGSLFDVPLSPSACEDDTPIQSTSNASMQEEIEIEDHVSLDDHHEEMKWVSPPQMETLEDDPPTPPARVLEGDIDRIHCEQWEGVNGCYNNQGEWFDWMQCLTVDIDEENSLQILPYVCID